MASKSLTEMDQGYFDNVGIKDIWVRHLLVNPESSSRAAIQLASTR
jgi:hypothetical protein